MSSEEANASDEEYDCHEKFLCSFDGCNAAFSKKKQLVNHTFKHTGERPFACDLPGCLKTYTNPSHLKRHKKVFHEKLREEIKCPHKDCTKVLASKQSLKIHIRRLHNPNRKYPFDCSECGKGFHKKFYLKQHLYLHTGKAPFECDKCARYFLMKRDYTRHLRTHTTYTCVCGSKYERWTALLFHKKTCKECVPVCNICNATFKSNMNLKHHLKVHDELEDRQVFLCVHEGCNKFYFYKKNLMHHELYYHKRIGEFKTIPCTEPGCDKTFVRMRNMKQHVENVHSSKPKEKKPRKPRWDKGIPKKSALSDLLGIPLPINMQQMIMSGIKQEELASVRQEIKQMMSTVEVQNEITKHLVVEKGEEQIEKEKLVFNNEENSKKAVKVIQNLLLRTIRQHKIDSNIDQYQPSAVVSSPIISNVDEQCNSSAVKGSCGSESEDISDTDLFKRCDNALKILVKP